MNRKYSRKPSGKQKSLKAKKSKPIFQLLLTTGDTEIGIHLIRKAG